MPADQNAATMSDERLRWIETWATGWRKYLDIREPDLDSYYVHLPIDVAVSMIEELAAEVRRVQS